MGDPKGNMVGRKTSARTRLTRTSVRLVSPRSPGGRFARLRLGESPDPSNLIRVMPAKGGNAVRLENPARKPT